jgi:hypothetical protein
MRVIALVDQAAVVGRILTTSACRRKCPPFDPARDALSAGRRAGRLRPAPRRASFRLSTPTTKRTSRPSVPPAEAFSADVTSASTHERNGGEWLVRRVSSVAVGDRTIRQPVLGKRREPPKRRGRGRPPELMGAVAVRHREGDRQTMLFVGDVSRSPAEDAVDVLVVSAFSTTAHQRRGVTGIGGVFFKAKDPEGNRVELWQPPAGQGSAVLVA